MEYHVGWTETIDMGVAGEVDVDVVCRNYEIDDDDVLAYARDNLIDWEEECTEWLANMEDTDVYALIAERLGLEGAS